MILHRILISKKSFYLIVSATAAVLLIPLVAMQLTNEVSWNIGDFVVAGTLLLGSGYLYEVLTKTSSSTVIKAIIGVIVFALLALVWAIIAVDLI